MNILQQQARAFTEFRGDNGKVMESLKRTVHVLHALSTNTTLREGVGLVRHMVFHEFTVPEARSIAFSSCETNLRSRWYPTRCLSSLVPIRVSI